MKVLVVAAHPDDEALGCGGTLARHAMAGDDVDILFLADGVGSRGSREALEARRQAARSAATILGVRPPRFDDLPDNCMDTVPLLDIVQRVETVVRAVEPEHIYTHHVGDLNIDHRLTAQAVLTACRPMAGSPVRSIHAFEVPSSTEWAAPTGATAFLPQRFVDIGAVLERKIAALAAYEIEMRAFPHPRSVEAITALARWRGAAAGLSAAEAFMVIREIS